MVFFRASPRSAEDPAPDLPPTGPVYRVYKRRFVGLAQLVLLNIIVSWDVCTLPPLFTGMRSGREIDGCSAVVDLFVHLDDRG